MKYILYYIFFFTKTSSASYSVSLWCYCGPRPYWATGLLIGLYPRKGVSAITSITGIGSNDASLKTVAVVAVRWDTHRRVCLGMCVVHPRPVHRSAWVLGSFPDSCVIWPQRSGTLLFCGVVVFVCYNYSVSGLLCWKGASAPCFYVRVTPTQRGSASLRRQSTETHADTEMRSCAWLSLSALVIYEQIEASPLLSHYLILHWSGIVAGCFCN